MVSPHTLKKKGWFAVAGRDGDRSLEQQLTGLELLFDEIAGKTVLDAGCAEGLISIELARSGAASCHGIDSVDSHIEVARSLAHDVPCSFEVINLNRADLQRFRSVDVVLMLAVLHKLENPSRVCAGLAALARDLCVIRLPPAGPVIKDRRSGFVEHDIDAVMRGAGFELTAVDVGHLDEWMGYYRRVDGRTA